METEKKRTKRKIRLKTKDVIFQLPPDLHNSIKAEVRSQGISLTSWMTNQMMQELKKGPLWRAFLKEQAQRPEALERGKNSGG